MITQQYKKGFTILELLVVIAIIGIIAAVVLVSLDVSRAQARNQVVVSQLVEYQKALDLFYTENGRYPQTRSTPGNTFRCLGEYEGTSCWDTAASINENSTFAAEVDDFMPSLPGGGVVVGDDRTFLGWIYTSPYSSGGNFDGYRIRYILEGEDQNCILPVAQQSSSGVYAGVTMCDLRIPE